MLGCTLSSTAVMAEVTQDFATSASEEATLVDLKKPTQSSSQKSARFIIPSEQNPGGWLNESPYQQRRMLRRTSEAQERPLRRAGRALPPVPTFAAQESPLRQTAQPAEAAPVVAVEAVAPIMPAPAVSQEALEAVVNASVAEAEEIPVPQMPDLPADDDANVQTVAAPVTSVAEEPAAPAVLPDPPEEVVVATAPAAPEPAVIHEVIMQRLDGGKEAPAILPETAAAPTEAEELPAETKTAAVPAEAEEPPAILPETAAAPTEAEEEIAEKTSTTVELPQQLSIPVRPQPPPDRSRLSLIAEDLPEEMRVSVIEETEETEEIGEAVEVAEVTEATEEAEEVAETVETPEMPPFEAAEAEAAPVELALPASLPETPPAVETMAEAEPQEAEVEIEEETAEEVAEAELVTPPVVELPEPDITVISETIIQPLAPSPEPEEQAAVIEAPEPESVVLPPDLLAQAETETTETEESDAEPASEELSGPERALMANAAAEPEETEDTQQEIEKSEESEPAPAQPETIASPLLPEPEPPVAMEETVVALKSELTEMPPAAPSEDQPFEVAALKEEEIDPVTEHLLRDVVPEGVAEPAPFVPKPEVAISRATVQSLEATEPEVKTHEDIGIRIAVKKPNFKVSDYLEKAYEVLVDGEYELAVDYYQAILEKNPAQLDALFGMAATYHRMGNLDRARELYDQILVLQPENLDTLNNLLVLASQESPRDALKELALLEAKNPSYDPIPAQMAAVYGQLEEFDQAIRKMKRAIELAPGNMTYHYNMAVLLDNAGHHDLAIAAYNGLKQSYLSGKKIPASITTIQERLTFLLSNMSS